MFRAGTDREQTPRFIGSHPPVSLHHFPLALVQCISGELLSILLRSVDPGVIKVVPFLNLHCGLNLISDAILRQATNLLGAFLELYDTRHGTRFETSVFVVDATTV